MSIPPRILVLLATAIRLVFAGGLWAGEPLPAKTATAVAKIPLDEYQQREAMSKLRAMELFPDIEKEDSPLRRRMDEEIAARERDSPETFKEPEWPTDVARFCAGCLGIRPLSIADILQHSPEKALFNWRSDSHFADLVIRNATYCVGKVELDVRRKLQAAVKGNALTVVCDDTLLPNLAEEGDAGREDGETGQEYWKRHLAAMEASTLNDAGVVRKLKVTYEREGRIVSLVIAGGHVLAIESPAEGKEASAPAAPVRAKD